MGAETAGRARNCSGEEWRIRVDLAAAYRLAARYGWDDLTANHFSARLPGPEHHFLINPFGMLFEEVTASSLVKIDLAGNKVEPSDWAVNPAGFTIHSAVHAAREDAQCVMHLHTRAGMAVSCQEGGLLPLNQRALTMISEVAYHEYEGVALNHEERPRLVADLGDKRTMILRNHGTLTVGETVGAAFVTMYFLETACQVQVLALGGGAALHYPPEKVRSAAAKRPGPGERFAIARHADELAWPALLRSLDRSDTSYRS
jgi:ribulose-5-phosphate 4-epimerase/fuculose-1-phosphate aldolase